jgi:16S rRNA (adenine1518-N6/adenine1519-N6)-dimethyltransferase
MRLSKINVTLREIGVSPVKTLGQNFLHDRNLARWIVEQADISRTDYIVEIGPGLGSLTQYILGKRASVLAIEKDARLARFLRKRFPVQQLEVLHADALEFDPRLLYAQPVVKLLGNLPYYISSQIMLKFMTYPSPISLCLLMLQKEMARRLSADPSTKDYGALTLQVQLHYRVEYLRSVSAAVFLPRPEVDSALVRITPRKPDELPYCDYELFRKLVRQGFAQRRKQLGKLLHHELEDWKKAADVLGISANARAEELSLLQWIALTNYVGPVEAGVSHTKGDERFAVVDAADRPIGSARRSKVHANNLLHRAVHVLIFNKKGEIYLQKRSRWKDRHPLAWDSSAAGHVSASEDYDAAARRELAEELGIETELEKIVKLKASKRTDFEFISLYRGSYDGELHPNSSEIEAGQYFSVSLVDDWIAARKKEFASAFLECWKVFRRTGA